MAFDEHPESVGWGELANPNGSLVEVPQLITQLFYLFLGGSCVCLFFEWPKKRHQKKGHPAIGSLRDYPALLAFIGAKINSLRSNKFSLNPMKAAMLGCIEGTKVKSIGWQHSCFYSLSQNWERVGVRVHESTSERSAPRLKRLLLASQPSPLKREKE